MRAIRRGNCEKAASRESDRGQGGAAAHLLMQPWRDSKRASAANVIDMAQVDCLLPGAGQGSRVKRHEPTSKLARDGRHFHALIAARETREGHSGHPPPGRRIARGL